MAQFAFWKGASGINKNWLRGKGGRVTSLWTAKVPRARKLYTQLAVEGVGTSGQILEILMKEKLSRAGN